MVIQFVAYHSINPINWLRKYKKLAENSLEKLKEFECLNMDLDAKLVLSKKFVDELKCENVCQVFDC